MFSQLKQFKNLHNQAKQLKNTLAQEIVTGEAAWGKVKIQINGNQEILNVEIDQELLTTENKAKLQSAIQEATNEALKKIQRIMADKMKQSGFSLPGV